MPGICASHATGKPIDVFEPMKRQMPSPASRPTPLSALAPRPSVAQAPRRKAATHDVRRELQPRSPRLVRHNGGGGTDLDAEQVLAALMELKKGQFGVRLPVAWT